jgi:hypothetical protein
LKKSPGWMVKKLYTRFYHVVILLEGNSLSSKITNNTMIDRAALWLQIIICIVLIINIAHTFAKQEIITGNDLWFNWVAPALLIWFLLVRRLYPKFQNKQYMPEA